jgi:hypothetical protein
MSLPLLALIVLMLVVLLLSTQLREVRAAAS